VTDELAPEPRPLGELFAELALQTGTLVRKELQLAKAEMRVKARDAGAACAQIAAGAAVTLGGGLALLTALVMLLATVLPPWVAAVVVGAIVSGSGAALTLTGVRRLQTIDAIPRRTLETLKEDKRWMREQLRQ
jgi:hypothetical protein